MIPVNTPLLDGNERKYLNECLDDNWISSEGPFVKRFEEGMAGLCGRKYGVAVTNGSAALDIAVAALQLQPGDEIIMSAFTIISCAAAVVRAGCVPVLVDADPVTWNMKTEDIESKITERTRALMVIHIYGLPVDMDNIMKIAAKYNLKIIEDAAEMHGQTYDGKPCGSFGDISTFSFYPNKHITTGEGGMIVTNDEHLAGLCRSYRNLFFPEKERRYIHEELGWNCRMSNIQAALGVAQLEKLPEHIVKKRLIGRCYNELFRDTPGIQLPLAADDHAENIYWVYGIVLDDSVPFDNIYMTRRLAEKKIGSRLFFTPMHMQPALLKRGLFVNESYPVSERLSRRGFYIPSGLGLSEDDIVCVADTVKDILKNG